MLNLVDLSDRHILITGASAGLGHDAALLLAQLGARLTLVAHSGERLNEVLGRLDGRGHRAISCDLSDFDAIPGLVRQSVDGLGPLDGLVHCAGVQIMRPLSMLTASHLDRTFKLNVNAALALVKSLASPGQFRPSASCVLLASVMGMVGQPVQSVYSASKGALMAMARSLALELARQQIRVNCIAPSLVVAGMGLAIEKSLTPEQFEKVVQMHPLGLGKGSDVASAAAFLLSSAARWITGTTLVVDGGYTAQSIPERDHMNAVIKAVEYHLPQTIETNEQLAARYPQWKVEQIAEKTGIHARHIAAANELASDLAVVAARKLFDSGAAAPADIDFILFCTQSPDYLLPTTACLLQSRLGIPTSAGALDFNLGCSGYVYGLGLAKGLIETGQSRNLLLLTAETYSKHMHPEDRTVRLLFGDAAAATLIQAGQSPDVGIGPFVFGTDGAGAANLIVRKGALRRVNSPDQPLDLHMNGPEIFAFTLNTIPKTVHRLLAAAGKSLAEIDLFIFHQANAYMLEHLRNRLEIPAEKFFVDLGDIGNTVSATIPIAIKQAQRAGRFRSGQLAMLVGFGVGYSWSATLVRLP